MWKFYKTAAFVACFAVLHMSTACAHETPLIVAGGELDPAFSGAEIYVGDPIEAIPPPGRACQAAKSYVDLINAGRFVEVAQLFADDAVFLEPTRVTLRGKDEIQAHYERSVGAMRPRIVAVSYVGDDVDCMVALAVQVRVRDQDRYALVSVDHFTMGDDGRFARMVAFARPRRTD